MTTKILRRTGLIELAGADVPSLMLRPDVDTPVPGVLLLHGYSSTKEVLSDTMGTALAARGIASLSFDLPLHGHRDDEMFEEAKTNPFGLLQHWKRALLETKDAIEWLISHDAVDEDRIGVRQGSATQPGACPPGDEGHADEMQQPDGFPHLLRIGRHDHHAGGGLMGGKTIHRVGR